MILHSIIDSPYGQLLAVAGNDHALTGLYYLGAAHCPSKIPAAVPRPATDVFFRVAVQLAEYAAGSRTCFDVPIRLEGTPFQREVWEAIRAIPQGETLSYSDLAAAVGRPRAVRAVGAATGANPVSILVPCHRVVGSNGALTGYAGGLERKRRLLEHEGAIR